MGKIKIDETLTPETATNRGYSWVRDVYYDPNPELKDEMQDLISLVNKKNYKLGAPASRMAQTIVSGLYAPLKNRSKH